MRLVPNTSSTLKVTVPFQAFPLANSPVHETFTIGVTDVMFNPTNAIFGRLLKAPDGRIIMLAYWHQKENESRDDIPYFNNK